MVHEQIPQYLEDIGRQIVDAAFQVHTELGPGLLESTYEEAMCFELASRGLKVVRQKRVPLLYKGQQLRDDMRLDIIINDEVIIEIKAVDFLLEVHEAQILTYLKLSRLRLGYLINFNVRMIKDGITRKVI